MHAWHAGEISALLESTTHYDAFEDLPWPFVYREMAAEFPDAKFVLSTRGEKEWIGSMRRHVGRAHWMGYRYCYGVDGVEGNEQLLLQRYRDHNAEVRSFFETMPNKLLEIDIDLGEATWERLCSFLGCDEVPKRKFPRSNTVASWGDDTWLRTVTTARSELIIFVEETCARLAYVGIETSGNGEAGLTWPSWPGGVVLKALWAVVSVCEQASCDLWWKCFVLFDGLSGRMSLGGN